MQTFQYATFDSKTASVIFKTRHASGRHFHFTLTKEQFLALDDAIALIERSHYYGHYPLGQNIWLHYTTSDASLYKQTCNSNRISFHFLNFREYKRYTHSRLQSFIHLTGKQNGRTRRIRYHGSASTARNQRPSSVAVQQTCKTGATERHYRRKRSITSRKTDDVKLSLDNETRSVFSERHRSDSRCSDSISSGSSSCTHLSAPSPIRLLSSNDTMESE